MRNVFFTALVILSACAPKVAPPEDLIPKDQMISLLTEVHLLESKIKNLNIYPLDSAKVVYDHYEKLLFADFNITTAQYETSFNYYTDNLNEFGKIYESVVDSLMRLEKLEDN